MTNPIITSFRLAFRDYETDGVAGSGEHEPEKSDVRELGGTIAAQIELLAAGYLVGTAVPYETLADRDADTGQADGQIGLVWGDPTPANNGVAVWVAGSPGSWEDAGFTLAASVLADIAAVQSDIAALQGAVSAEEAARIAADGALDARLDAVEPVVTANTAAISAEETARIAADAALQTQVTANATDISAEETARIAADAGLQSQIDSASSDVAAEAAARIAADTALAGDISAEATARADADADLDARLDAVEPAVTANTAAIAAEASARAAADGALDARVSTLETDLPALAGDVADEETARIAADDALGARLDAVEPVVTANTAAIAAEETARIAADGALDVRLNRFEGEAEFAAGWLDPAWAPVSAVYRDAAGRPVMARLADSALATLGPDGIWRREGAYAGLRYGFLEGAAAETVALDQEARAVSAVLADGATAQIDAYGLWSARGVTRWLSAGWLLPDMDATTDTACIDREGRLIWGRGGFGHVGVETRATPAGYARLDYRSEPGQVDLVFASAMPVPPAQIESAFGPLTVGGGFLASPPTATEAVPPEVISLTYGTARRLSYQYVRGVTVTRVSDAATLTEDVDYRLNPNQGTIEGLVNTPAHDCSVDYTGHYGRVEYVTAHRTTGRVSLTAGPEVKRWFSEYEPAVPAGDVLIWRAIRTPEGASLVPSYLYSGVTRLDRPLRHDVAEARRLLEPVRVALTQGKDLVLYGYGDSITQIGSASPYTNDDLNLAPNGPRDRINHFEFWDASTKSLIPTSDLGDGRGNTHIEVGWNWWLKSHIEDTYGVTVSYQNYGIGGSTSANSVAGNGLMNGLYPARINVVIADIEAAVAADKVAIVVLAFGMNTGVDHYGNTRAIVQALTAAGATVIVMSPVRPNPRYLNVSQDDWRLTSAHLALAARDEGAPFVDCRALYDDDALGAAGRTREELCGATLNNHPDRDEYRRAAALLTQLF